MLDNNTVYFLNIIWTYCTCMYYVSEINEYYYYYNGKRIIRTAFGRIHSKPLYASTLPSAELTSSRPPLTNISASIVNSARSASRPHSQ